ncbi:TetR family transcriptional regulator C-terminal domain-containing protein [Zhihengliuella alba]|uniref:TetR family transcriptional regulator C-terminal domain-containing protein n=1 Tax=Zhihengliuella alba TaxID=547018 RepID=A0ABP7CP59_9MICC
MPRTQAFARDDVVRAARALFWRSGYDNTSIPELEQATGLSRSSIYNTFGSKRGLFDAAVRSYFDEILRPRLGPLQAETVEPHAVLEYLDGMRQAFEQAGSLPATCGCLLINAAGAPIGQDAAVAGIIAEYRSELRAAIERGIEAHSPGLPGERTSQLADVVTGLIIAAFALIRVAPAEAAASLGTARDLICPAGAA